MTVIENPLLLRKKATDEAYQIKRSLRFNSADSSKLSHTFSLGNIRIWTWSGWVKRNSLGVAQSVFGSPDTGNTTDIEFDSSDRLIFTDGPSVYAQTTAVFRDPAAWYHIVCAHDTTQNIASERVKLYVNGVLQPVTLQTYGWNSSADFGTAAAHTIGSSKDVYSNTTLADIQYIDGMALAPAAFGSFDSTGLWKPKAFALPTPNDGTTWSSKVTGSAEGAYPATQAFDGGVDQSGDFVTYAYPSAGGTLTFTPDDPIPCQSLRIYTRNDANGGGVKVNGIYQGDVTTTPTWYDYTPDSHSITSISWHRASSGSVGCQIYAIEIDGVRLIDGRTDITERDNINDGTTWSGDVSGTPYTNQGGDKAFDGRSDTLSQASNPGNASLTWVPSSSITGRVEILIAAGAHGGSVTGEFDLKIGNVSKFDNSIWPNNHTRWVDLGTQTIDTTYGLKWGNGSGGNWHGIKMIKIDGVPLVDGTNDNSFHLKFDDISTNAAIGTDTLGNGNWTVTNLFIGDDNVNQLTSTGTFESGRDALKAFNGLVGGTDYAHAASGQTCTISFTAVTGITKLRLNIAKNSGGDNWGTFELNDTDDITSWLQSNHGGTGNSGTWIDVTSQLTGTSLSKLEFSTSGNNDVRVAGVEVNDKILVSLKQNDSCVDSPTNYGTDTGAGGEVRGNYCTLNPLDSTMTGVTKGGLDYYNNTGAFKEVVGTMGVKSGKWYYEVECYGGDGTGNSSVGWAYKTTTAQTGGGSVDYAVMFENAGWDQNFSTSKTNRSITVNEGDILGVSLDLDAGTPIMRTWVNDAQQNTINLGGSWSAGMLLFPYVNSSHTGGRWRNFNFGQRPWQRTCPSGYKALCSTNLPDLFSGDNVNNPSKVTEVKKWEGNGTSGTDIKCSFRPDLVWIKNRTDASTSYCIHDVIRGEDKGLHSDATQAEWTDSTTLSDFNSDGFELGNHSYVNGDTKDYVAWIWDAGSSASGANNSGSTNISAGDQWVNDAAGFSITKYTGTGSDATFGHGLSAKPEWIIIKKLNSSGNWTCQHVGTTLGSGRMILDETYANDTTNADTYWNSTAPTNTLISIGDHTNTNGSGDTFICYAWRPVNQYSHFGSYLGGAANRFINCGFKPRLVLIKCHDVAGESWFYYDSERGATAYLMLDNNSQEYTNANTVHFNANGFLLPGTGNGSNGSSKNYIFGAWAEHPFKTAKAGNAPPVSFKVN